MLQLKEIWWFNLLMITSGSIGLGLFSFSFMSFFSRTLLNLHFSSGFG
ncbi:hypothetical protein Pint_08800 [Pistacia integerrima]|uniref:Uncharacterized protein n=1 Tax=Pistacia integerrima TaxID=434235 RepID=A0ACC0Y120_9ROSI|nr:hypothetical protein Pint_08800 [Pistacia integerrima]